MNVIEIQNLINQIGDLKTSFNQQTQEYSLNELPVANINLNDDDALYGEYQIKLKTQLNQKSDVSLLNKLLLSVNRFEKELYEHYHFFRIKLSESNNLNKDLIHICKIIDVKLDCLFLMKTDLENTILNFDFKLKTDFGGEESQSKGKPFEDDELELSGVPKLNLSNRFKLLKSLKIVDVLEELKIDKKQKTILLALTMGINIDNARHLLSNTYPDPPKSKERELENFFIKYNINL